MRNNKILFNPDGDLLGEGENHRKHPGKNGTELVLIYAWNELDEGGWLVPTLPPPDGEGTARIDALRKVTNAEQPTLNVERKRQRGITYEEDNQE